MEKIWTKEEIKNLIQTNDKMVIRSLIQLYNRQTADEQIVHEAAYQNGIGFNGVDAPILSSFVEFYKERNFLTAKQINIARKKLVKYSGQLEKIANKKI